MKDLERLAGRPRLSPRIDCIDPYARTYQLHRRFVLIFDCLFLLLYRFVLCLLALVLIFFGM